MNILWMFCRWIRLYCPVNPLAMPFFKRQQGPKLPAVVAFAAGVFADELFNHSHIEEAALARRLAKQHIAHWGHVAAQPGCQGDAEAVFFAVDNIIGQEAAGGLFQNDLAAPAGKFEIEGKWRRRIPPAYGRGRGRGLPARLACCIGRF